MVKPVDEKGRIDLKRCLFDADFLLCKYCGREYESQLFGIVKE